MQHISLYFFYLFFKENLSKLVKSGHTCLVASYYYCDKNKVILDVRPGLDANVIVQIILVRTLNLHKIFVNNQRR